MGKDGGANAGGHVDFLSVYLEAFTNGLPQALGHNRSLVPLGVALHENKEIIIARPGYGALRVQQSLQAFGHGLQQLVAAGVALVAVDVAEIVQIHGQHHQALVFLLGAGDGQSQEFIEQELIGQTGEGVIVGLVLYLLLGLLYVADVMKHAHKAGGLAPGVLDGGDGQLFGVGLAALAAVPYFALPITILRDGLPHALVKLRAMAVGFEDARVLPQSLFLGIAGDRGESAVYVLDVALGVGDGYAFHRAVKHLAGHLQLVLGLLALGGVLHRADHAQGLSLLVVGHLADLVHYALASIGADDAVFDVVGLALVNGLVDGLLHKLPVIGMHSIQEVFIGSLELLRRYSEDAVILLRPTQLAAGDIPVPVAHVGNLLGPGQAGLAFAQLLQGPFALYDAGQGVGHDGQEIFFLLVALVASGGIQVQDA